MPEETTPTETTETTETVETPVEVAASFNPFAEQTEQPVIETETEETPEVTATTETPAKTETEVVDANEYLKTNLGFEDWDSAKAAFAELKELKEKAQTPAEIKFANDEAKKLFEYIKEGKTDEVLEILSTQKTLAAVDKMDAAAAIKLKIKQDNKHFTSDDIQDVFEEKYSTDEKPVQGIDELEEEFTARLNKWQVKAEKVNRRIERDAVSAKAELSKLRSELVLPDIFKKEEAAKPKEPTQEELDRNKAYTESYLRSAEASVKNFTGFNVTVKDKDVEIPITYGLSEVQKTEVANVMKTLAAKGYNVNEIFAPRWFKKDGITLDTDRMTKDVARMLYGDQVDQKIATEAANKRVVEKAKKDSNIQLRSNSTPQRTFAPVNSADEQKKMAEFFFQS